MKMDMSAKEAEADIEPTSEGEYSQEQLEDMLEAFIRVKKIEADPTLLALVRNYAKSKNKMVEDLFDVNSVHEKPKSFADLKKIKAKVDKNSDNEE